MCWLADAKVSDRRDIRYFSHIIEEIKGKDTDIENIISELKKDLAADRFGDVGRGWK